MQRLAQTLTANAPTATTIPPPTDTPKPSLDTVALTFDDIDSILAGYFNAEYTENKPDFEESLFGTSVFYQRTFLGKGNTGDIEVLLLQYDSANSASWQNSQAQLFWTVESVPIPSNFRFPVGAWMTETSVSSTGERWLILGFHQGQVGVLLSWYRLPEGYDTTKAAFWLALIGQVQQRRLQEAGYE